ncbi:MAG: hypothetical protein PHV11_06965 [Candidatus Bipolaricaulis sp.]|nr:hypothetical protein [Candidatus Bipolaricaulis sp.]
MEGEKDFRDHDLLHSATEENMAARVYRLRAQYSREHGDIATADLYEHIAKEEDQHEAEFKERLKAVDLINRKLFQDRMHYLSREICNRVR